MVIFLKLSIFKENIKHKTLLKTKINFFTLLTPLNCSKYKIYIYKNNESNYIYYDIIMNDLYIIVTIQYYICIVTHITVQK